MAGLGDRRGPRRGPRRASTGRPLAHAASRPLPTGRVPGAGSRPEARRTGRRIRTASAPVRPRHQLFTGRGVLLVGLVLLLALTLAGPVQQYLAGRADIARLAAEGAELDQRIAEQEARLAELRDPAVLAREARERFFYVAEGDRLIRVVDGAEADGDAGTVPEAAAPRPQTWYDALMGSLGTADDLGQP
ncbi:septum formation initiator family protein [Blastococcus sp. URHD0036]|uniref:septum formation initiator family protein n=1 Tax=Blastococcus sp. URHD0036 TaxID=1380356 RepID=UPI0005550F81|nr:septum formation initiator family protein [Blastococcus sp. URHD0036]